MAKIIFSLPEILEIFKSNNLIPGQIENLRAEENLALFQIETGWVLPTKIAVSLGFLGFESGIAIFHTKIEWVPDMISKPLKPLMCSLLKKKELEKYIDLNEYPNIAINLDKILTDKIKGIQVKDIVFDNGLFTIAT